MQLTLELPSWGFGLHLCFTSPPDLNSHIHLTLPHLGLQLQSAIFAQTPLHGADPMLVPTSFLQHQDFPGGFLHQVFLPLREISTYSLGKYSCVQAPTAQARPQQRFRAAWMESAVPKPRRKSALRGTKTVQDTLRSLKAIWHFVKFNSIPHILPALSKLRCPTNLAPLPCLPLQNRISFQREMCPSKICIFLASNYGNIFHLLCLSLGVFSLTFGISF